MRWALALGPTAVRGVLALLRIGLNHLGRPIRQLRTEWKLPPQAVDPILGAALSPYGTLALYSSHFAPLPKDLGTPVIATGFARYDADERGTMTLDPALAAFLAAGSPPVVLTLGSSFVWNPGRFYVEGLAAVRALGHRAVLLMGEAAHDRANLQLADADVYVGDYVPYSALLPHAAAVIHHGGIGTCAQALQAGIPQLVVPHFGDQPDNAHRLMQLGVAEVLERRRFTAARATPYLATLLGSSEHQRHAQVIAATLHQKQGATNAASAIDTWTRLGRLAL
jgi:UDP:flavonoid glycosyltransferase YjiC (YdhE family)